MSFVIEEKTAFAFNSTDTTIVSKTTAVVTKSSMKSNSSVSINANDVMENLAADLSTKGKMKDHFRVGMKFFMKDQYDAAIPDLIAATKNGKGKMPAYSGKLTTAQIKDVVAYIRTLQK